MEILRVLAQVYRDDPMLIWLVTLSFVMLGGAIVFALAKMLS
jgi:hypothetical protein